MKIIAVIESRRWVNRLNKRTASIYGAVPWTHPSDKINWSMETVGWTWQLANGTIGLGRVPASSRAEAERVMTEFNARGAK